MYEESKKAPQKCHGAWIRRVTGWSQRGLVI